MGDIQSLGDALYGRPANFSIPLWAYHMSDWWLLFGIAVSYIGISSAGQYSSGIFLFCCYCIGFWIHNGFDIHHYTTFCFLCAALAYMTWHLADTIRIGCPHFK